MTDTTTTEPDKIAQAFAFAEDVPDFAKFFEDLGVPTLRAALDQPGGLLSVVDAEQAGDLATTAAILEHDGQPLPASAAKFVGFNADCLLNTICSDSEAFRMVDGVPTLQFEGFPPFEVTEEKIRQWQWIVTMFVITEVPTRYLDQLPPAMSDQARREAVETADDRHATIDMLKAVGEIQAAQ